MNILIIGENSDFNMNLSKLLRKDNFEIKNILCSVNINDIEHILSKQNIDVLIIDYKKYVNMKLDLYINLVNNIKKIILLVEKKDNNFINGVHSVYKYKNIESIVKKINEIIKGKTPFNNKLRQKILAELIYINYNIKYLGTKYLVEAILISKNMFEESDDNLERTIYPIVAKKYNTTVHNIKCNINYATNNMYYECNEEKLKEYFNMNDIWKPSPKIVIETIINRIY